MDGHKKGEKTPALGEIKDIKERSLHLHEKHKGVIENIGKVVVKNSEDLAIYYTPGVAYTSLAIKDNKELSYKYTGRGNRIAILTDASRILGLGDIGPEAGLSVMEGKALLFKRFGNVDAIPLAINANNADDIVAVAKAIEPSFGGINIEDTASPKCFEVFDRLQSDLSIPVFHDDRQGTAVVADAALKNALKVVGKKLKDVRIVMNGSGAAGVGITQLLVAAGAKHVIVCDTKGIIYKGRDQDMNWIKQSLAEHTNKELVNGSLADAVKGADVLIGASARGAFTEPLIRSMNSKPIVFALANPEPEIRHSHALAAGAAVVATGESDVPNQVNNLLAFPAIFRGALDVNARKINDQMLVAASDALAKSVPASKLSNEYIIPNFVDANMANIATNIAVAVAKAAMDSGVARKKVDLNEMKRNVKAMLKRYSKLEKLVGKLSK